MASVGNTALLASHDVDLNTITAVNVASSLSGTSDYASSAGDTLASMTIAADAGSAASNFRSPITLADFAMVLIPLFIVGCIVCITIGAVTDNTVLWAVPTAALSFYAVTFLPATIYWVIHRNDPPRPARRYVSYYDEEDD